MANLFDARRIDMEGHSAPEGRDYELLIQRCAQVHATRQAKASLVEMRERRALAREA